MDKKEVFRIEQAKVLSERISLLSTLEYMKSLFKMKFVAPMDP